MKKEFRLVCILAIMMLSSCSGGLPDLALPDIRLPVFNSGADDIRQADFYDSLAEEYKNLAAFEQDFMKHEDDAAHFSAKARRALRRQDVAPDRPVDRNIPDFSIEELQSAYSMLTDALNTMQSEANAALLAMAQTRYDCWLSQQEDFPEPREWNACKTAFYDALALLTVPAPETQTYAVYFDSASTEISPEARSVIESFANRYGARGHWDIVLHGYADPKGDKAGNRTLSMRRAIAVKNTLGQFGVDLDNIAISAEGAPSGAGQGEDGDSRRVEIVARPHYAARNKEGLSVLSGWSHSAEF